MEDFSQVTRCLGMIPPLENFSENDSDSLTEEEDTKKENEDELMIDFNFKKKRLRHRKNRIKNQYSVNRKESMFMYNVQEDKK